MSRWQSQHHCLLISTLRGCSCLSWDPSVSVPEPEHLRGSLCTGWGLLAPWFCFRGLSACDRRCQVQIGLTDGLPMHLPALAQHCVPPALSTGVPLPFSHSSASHPPFPEAVTTANTGVTAHVKGVAIMVTSQPSLTRDRGTQWSAL